VSPLWRDETGIFIGPSKVVLAKMKRGFRPECVAEQGFSVDVTDESDWRSAMQVLRQQLNDTLWHNANVRVVVSDHWTRYTMLPWSSELARPSEKMAHARMILNNKFGDIADDWSISLSDNRPLDDAIVSAMPTQLLDELDVVLTGNGLRLVSLQPQLIVAYNRWRDKLSDSAAWFASVDDGSLAALHLTNGRCDRVRSVRISDDWTVEMRRMQTMGRLAQGRPAEGRVFVDAPQWMQVAADKEDASLAWLDQDREPADCADKVSMLKGMVA
jgi:hypothetical protein